MNGNPSEVVGQTETIFDTGTTMIIGDPAGIEQLYAPLLAVGAMPAPPQDGVGLYTSTWAGSTVDQLPHNA
jgi:hypothetical protein